MDGIKCPNCNAILEIKESITYIDNIPYPQIEGICPHCGETI